MLFFFWAVEETLNCDYVFHLTLDRPQLDDPREPLQSVVFGSAIPNGYVSTSGLIMGASGGVSRASLVAAIFSSTAGRQLCPFAFFLSLITHSVPTT